MKKLTFLLLFFAQASFAQMVSNPANQALDPSFALKSIYLSIYESKGLLSDK